MSSSDCSSWSYLLIQNRTWWNFLQIAIAVFMRRPWLVMVTQDHFDRCAFRFISFLTYVNDYIQVLSQVPCHKRTPYSPRNVQHSTTSLRSCSSDNSILAISASLIREARQIVFLRRTRSFNVLCYPSPTITKLWHLQDSRVLWGVSDIFSGVDHW